MVKSILASALAIAVNVSYVAGTLARPATRTDHFSFVQRQASWEDRRALLTKRTPSIQPSDIEGELMVGSPGSCCFQWGEIGKKGKCKSCAYGFQADTSNQCKSRKFVCNATPQVTSPTLYAGWFSKLESFTSSEYDGFNGSASLVVEASGISSEVNIRGTGAFAGKTFNAHLHALPCSEDGGGHYQDPNGNGAVDDTNENWPTTVCDVDSSCNGTATNTWAPNFEDLKSGLSIVVHDTPNAASGSGSKAFCADLRRCNTAGDVQACLRPCNTPKTLAECKNEAEEAGLSWDGTRNWNDRLPGCLKTKADGDINWNMNVAGTDANADQIQFCD